MGFLEYLFGPKEDPWCRTDTPAPAAAQATVEPPAPAAPSSADHADKAKALWSEAPHKDYGPPGSRTVYLGMGEEARKAEGAAFANRSDVIPVEAHSYGDPLQGKVVSESNGDVLDPSKPEDLERFLIETGIARTRTDANGAPIESEEDAQARVKRLEAMFLQNSLADDPPGSGIDAKSRDEVASLIRILQAGQDGKIDIDRMIISGHHLGYNFFDETGFGPSFEQLQALFHEFPEASHVKHLMTSACHTLEPSFHSEDGAKYPPMFPEIETLWGYDGKSPTWNQGSPEHIRSFLKASDTKDPTKIAAAARAAGGNAKVKTYR